MIAASVPIHRPADAKLLAVDALGRITHQLRSSLTSLLTKDDVIIANDAATLPASLLGTHAPTGRPVEVRLAGRLELTFDRVSDFAAVVFGAGDFRTPTERRPSPPDVRSGDEFLLGPLRASVLEVREHSRLVTIRFHGLPSEIWHGLVRHGRPIQYAHVPQPLAIWDTWSAIAALPVAFEPPSAGFLLHWHLIGALASRGIRFGTITHAVGLSSTGDPKLDSRLPFDEPYRIPPTTAELIEEAWLRGGRIIAIGTSVVRALEHAAIRSGSVRSGEGLATQKIGVGTELRVVDALVSGTHEPGTSHYELLRAFADDVTLREVDEQLDAHGYRTHEFGDSVFVERTLERRIAGSWSSASGQIARRQMKGQPEQLLTSDA